MAVKFGIHTLKFYDQNRNQDLNWARILRNLRLSNKSKGTYKNAMCPSLSKQACYLIGKCDFVLCHIDFESLGEKNS